MHPPTHWYGPPTGPEATRWAAVAPDLHAPPTGREPLVLRRGRLLRHLDRGATGPLTVLTAPAGYGKSLLLEEWVERAPGPVVAARFEDDDGGGP